jgi:peptidylprolyl isomerase
LTNSLTNGGISRTRLCRAIAGILIGALTALGLRAPDTGEAWAASPEDTLLMDLKDGQVVIEMRPDLAPHHVARIKELVGQGFYDGLTFHRVIRGFMAQTGDPNGDGTGGSGVKLEAEFSSEPHVRGTLSMARGTHPDSADSQFFIVFARTRHLDNQYTVWGQVIDGMEYVGKIKRGADDRNGAVDDPDRIIRLRVSSDVKK